MGNYFKYIFYCFLFGILTFNVSADVTLPIRVQTEDAGTVVDGVWNIKITNGDLSDNTGGSVSIDTSGAAGTPGGSDTQVQFNDSSSFGGDAGFTYVKATDTAHLVGSLGAEGTVDTPILENSFSTGITVRAKLDAYGYDVGTTVITVNTFTDEGIQAAIDALPSSGGRVQLLPGTYECDETIVITSRVNLNMSIVGSGRETILNHSATDGSDCISLTGPGGTLPERARGLLLADFNIVGNTLAGDGIYLQSVDSSTVRNIEITDAGDDGLEVQTVGSSAFIEILIENADDIGFNFVSPHQPKIVGCEAAYCETGIQANGEQIVISGCAFEHNTNNVILAGNRSFKSPGVMSGCEITGGTYGIKFVDANSWIVAGCLISDNSNDEITIDDSQHISIVGNKIMSGIIDMANSSFCTITGNAMKKDLIVQDGDCYYNRIYNNGTLNDDILARGASIIIEDCEDTWVSQSGDVTATLGTGAGRLILGLGSSKLDIDAAFSSGLIATEDFSAIDLSGYNKVGFWIYPTETVGAGVLELVLDNSAACGSPLETLALPALDHEDKFEYVELTFSDPSALTAIVSVGLNANSDPGTIVVYLDEVSTDYPQVWYDNSEATLEIDGTNVEISDRLVSAHIVANLGLETNVNITLEPKHLRFNLWNPNAMYDDDETVCIWPQTDAAITVSQIELTLDADPTTELNTDLMFADVFIAHPSATVIDELTTTAGTTSISSGFDDPTVPASKAIFIRFDGDPDSAITQANYDITFSYD